MGPTHVVLRVVNGQESDFDLTEVHGFNFLYNLNTAQSKPNSSNYAQVIEPKTSTHDS